MFGLFRKSRSVVSHTNIKANIAIPSNGENNNEMEDPSESNPKISMYVDWSSSKKRLLHQRPVLPGLVYMGNAIIVILLLIGVVNVDFWWTITAFTGLQGAFIPLWWITWYPHMRQYSLRLVRYYYNGILGCSLNHFWCVNGCTSKVSPLPDFELAII